MVMIFSVCVLGAVFWHCFWYRFNVLLLLCRFVYGPSFWTTFCSWFHCMVWKSTACYMKIKCGARKWSANLVSKWICFLGLLCGSHFGVKIVSPNWGRILLYINSMIVRVFVWLSTTWSRCCTGLIRMPTKDITYSQESILKPGWLFLETESPIFLHQSLFILSKVQIGQSRVLLQGRRCHCCWCLNATPWAQRSFCFLINPSHTHYHM